MDRNHSSTAKTVSLGSAKPWSLPKAICPENLSPSVLQLHGPCPAAPLPCPPRLSQNLLTHHGRVWKCHRELSFHPIRQTMAYWLSRLCHHAWFPLESQPLAMSDLSQAEPPEEGGDGGFRENQQKEGLGWGRYFWAHGPHPVQRPRGLTFPILPPHALPRGVSISSDDWVVWPL